MIPYFFLMGATAVVGIFPLLENLKFINKPYIPDRKKYALNVFFFVWLLMLCCRSKYCGIDLLNYEYYFDQFGKFSFTLSSIKEAFLSYDIDIGFIVYNLFIHLISDNYNFFLGATAIVSLVPLWWFYKRESECALLTVMTFITFGLFSLYFSGLRQCLAITLVIPAYYACRNRKPLAFVIFCLLALTIHKSAFVMLALYPVYHMTIRKKHMWIVLPMIVICYVFKSRIFLFLTQLISYEGLVSSTGAYGILVLLGLMLAYAFVIPTDYRQTTNAGNDIYIDHDFIGLRNLLLLSLVLQLFAPVHSLAMRINYYFLLLAPITISKVAPRASNQYLQVGKLAVLLMSCFFLLAYISKAGPGDVLQVYPYTTFW